MTAEARSTRRVGLLCAATGAILFSAKAILAKFQYRYGIDALDVLALRMSFAAPLFAALAICESRRADAPALDGRDRMLLVALGLLGYYLSSLLDFWGLEYIPVALERLILFLNPTFVLLLGVVVFARRVSHRQWLALLVSYAGIALVFIENLRLDSARVAFGSLLVLGAALSYAVYLALSGELVQRVGSMRLVCWAMGLSTVAVLTHYLLVRDVAPLLALPAAVYALAAANALFCTFLPVSLTMLAVARIGSGPTAQLSVLGPVSLVFLGGWLLDEPITVLQLLGTVVVLAGVGVLLKSSTT